MKELDDFFTLWTPSLASTIKIVRFLFAESHAYFASCSAYMPVSKPKEYFWVSTHRALPQLSQTIWCVLVTSSTTSTDLSVMFYLYKDLGYDAGPCLASFPSFLLSAVQSGCMIGLFSFLAHETRIRLHHSGVTAASFPIRQWNGMHRLRAGHCRSRLNV